MDYPDLPAHQLTLDHYYYYISGKDHLPHYISVLPKLYALNDHPGCYNFINRDANYNINYNISLYYNLSLRLLNYLSLT